MIMETFSKIDLQVMWNRLLAVVEEQGQALMRAAFSAMVRECGDISAGIFDCEGRMLAQAVTGTPGHVNSMANACPGMLAFFPVETMRPGDIYATNDPWLGTGHLNDLLLVAPVFHDGKIVALVSCTSHFYDIGGLGMTTDSSDVLEEGIRLPPMKFVSEGEINQLALGIIKANSRTPIANEGDIYALIACCNVGQDRLSGMMQEFRLPDLNAISEYILETSRRGIQSAIRDLPNGKYENACTLDGYDFEIDIRANMLIRDDRILVDFRGSSGMSRYGINVPLNYATAYTVYGIRCFVGPDIPNNAGSLEPIRITAPVGSILNASDPAPVSMRHMVGQILPDVVLGCLHQAIPGRIPAESVGCMWNLPLRSAASAAISGNATAFATDPTHNGGMGARPMKDGLSATAFPSGVWGSQIETTESQEPIRYLRRELRPDSGGAGKYRGGDGQIIEVENREAAPMQMAASFERMIYPAAGRDGGHDGRPGTITLRSGRTLVGKGVQEIPGDESLIFHMPGGGGYGDPLYRDPDSVLRDVRHDLITTEIAADKYGVVIDDNQAVDAKATQALRTKPGSDLKH
jgi:N-methylhydantoinase B